MCAAYATITPMTPDDLAGLADDWALTMRSANKSPQTIRTYLAGVHQFPIWCEGQGIAPDLTKRNAEAFTAALLDGGAASGTAYVRNAALRRFSKWCFEEGE